MTVDDSLIGRQLANFRIERVLGRGGMGVVYYGWDVKLQRPVAIKVIDARYRGRPHYAQRFLQEARAVATWRHAHITQVFYADDQDGLYYYVMEYVDGLDLSDLLDQYRADGETMPYEDVMRIGYAVASALDYAHRKGVIHRDVKPSNIMVARDGRILLADFGLAMDVEQGSQGEVFGSPHYVAPEQARRSANAVPQSDLYSLAVILYEILTGTLPFDDPSPTAVALQHLTLPPPPPRERNPNLSAEVDAVLLQALRKAPAERYRTGLELMDALGKALFGGQAVPPAGTTTWPPLVRAVTPSSAERLPRSHTTVADRVALHLGASGTLASSLKEERARQARRYRRWLLGRLGGGLLLIAVVVLLVATLLRNNGAVSSAANAAATLTAAPAAALPSPSPLPAALAATASPVPAPPDVAVTAVTVVAVTVIPMTVIPMTVMPMTVMPAEPSAALPTSAPTAAAPTVLYPDGRELQLLYNAGSFYVLNMHSEPVEIGRAAFELLDASGFPTDYRFDGRRWAEFYAFLDAGSCNVLELFDDAAAWLRPVSCAAFNARITPLSQDEIVFWTSHAAETTFRVLWNEAEVGRCEIAARQCTIFLPQSDT